MSAPAVAQLEGVGDVGALNEIPRACRHDHRHRKWNGVGELPSSIARASAARPPKPVERTEPSAAPAQVVRLFPATEVTSYTELIEAIREKVAVLGIRYLDFDELAGMAPGLSGKVFGPAQARRLGAEKLFDALRAAGLRLRVENDPDQHAKMQRRISELYNPRQANQARPKNNNHIRPSDVLVHRVLLHLLTRAGGQKRLNESATKKSRSKRARCARQKKE